MSPSRVVQRAVLGVAILSAAVRVPVWVADDLYGARVFPWLQWRLTGLTNLVPFAVLDVALVAAVVWLAWGAVAVVRAGRGRHWATFWRWEWRYITAFALVYVAFLGAWGLNYQRQPLTAALDFDESRITPEAVRAFAELSLSESIRARAALGDGPLPDEPRAVVAGRLEVAFHDATRALRVPGSVRPGRPKLTLLDPFYTRAGVAGMTDPIFLETFLASNLLPHEMPAVLAHEWGHLAGFARESEASFVGWLVCVRGDAHARYSAWLSMVLRGMAAVERDDRRALRARIPQAILDDLDAARRRDERDLVRLVTEASQRTYDQYLKANRVATGIRNYGEVLQLAVGTRFTDGWTPVRR